MAILDKKTVKSLTNLCRIRCTEEEEEALLKDLQKILGHIEQLSEVNTDNVSPCHHVLDDVHSALREDKIENVLDRDLFLANAPSHVAGMIRVPTVIKQAS